MNTLPSPIMKWLCALALFILLACNLPFLTSPPLAEPEANQPAQPAQASPSAPQATQPLPADLPAGLIQPSSLQYQGAFRLPEGGERPLTFAYGGSAMTFNPDGDPNGAADGFSGSLFISGHDRLAYGELPDGGQVAEVSIPAPLRTTRVAELPVAEFRQPFQDVARGFFLNQDEIPRLGMLYLDTPVSGPKIHLAWGQHLSPDTPPPTHALFNPLLSSPDTQGEWFISGANFYSVNGYMMEIPAAWAEAHTNGRMIGSGRFRDGGLSGMGPALYAYTPWLDENGALPADGSSLASTPLLLYENPANTQLLERDLSGYQHPDEWEGAAWLTSAAGNSAVLFAGTKSSGEKFWYGFTNPAGPDSPCVQSEAAEEYVACRMADGSPCPPADMVECAAHNDYRGWWSSRFEGQFLFYNPADLARVASGEIQPWEPQPYATLNINEHLFLNPDAVEEAMLGVGVQRRFLIGEAAYDRAGGKLYLIELYADGAKPVVHVWSIVDE